MNVFTALKHLFIPHHGNDFKPHIFREVAVSAVLFVSVFLLGSSFGSSFFIHRTVLGAEVASSVLIDLTNESRIASNEIPLLKSDKLEKAAKLKGQDMVDKEYFAHNSPDGVTPWHWLHVAGYSFLYAGENLAINFSDSTDVEKAWLNSPKHKANILNGEFREIGIATVPGMYNNAPTIYIVQMFGTPAYAEVADETEQMVTVVEKPKSIQAPTSTTTTSTTTVIGDVRGESVQASSTLLQVPTTGEMVVVKNTAVVRSPTQTIFSMTTYSTWYDRIIFNGSHYIDIIYKVLLLLIAFALVTMIVIEIKKQHVVHIIYGVSLLLLLQLFIYINQSFF